MDYLSKFYEFFQLFGYFHPIHPPFTHLTIGGTACAFIFGLIGFVLKNGNLARAAWYCAILALVSILPSALFGFVDWEYFYEGFCPFAIKAKIFLAVMLVLFLGFGVIAGRKQDPRSLGPLTGYFLAFLAVTLLGFFGANLVYSDTPAATTSQLMTGQKIYKARCAVCHPHGGNTLDSARPVRGSEPLKDFNAFLSFMHDPRNPDGTRGKMPSFTQKKLSDADEKMLYDYIVNAFPGKTRR